MKIINTKLIHGIVYYTIIKNMSNTVVNLELVQIHELNLNQINGENIYLSTNHIKVIFNNLLY